jgi:phosphoribosylanthranilate isomerase
MTKIKICGVVSHDVFDAVVAAQVDFIGFNFFPKSPRFVTPVQAAALSKRHQGGPLRVGLFVKPVDHEIDAVLQAVGLDVLQIYDDFPRVEDIKARFNIPVWQAVGVSSRDELPDKRLDGYVVESKPPPGATRPGGNAAMMDFSLLKDWQSPAFWLLAGGLTPENVVDAIRQTQTPGVDVSSGVETAPGVKSAELIKKFVEEVRKNVLF